MKAMVTLYHWDMPQRLHEEFGGWASIGIVDKFMDFSRIVIKRLKKVAYWITINEPKQLCNLAYETGGFAPGVYNKFYECVYSVLMCHASVYHMYKKEFADREGKMSIALDFEWSEPKTNSANDRAAASRNIDFEFSIYADPIILGDYPKVVKGEGDQKESGTFDYMAINHYTTYYVQDAPEGHSLNAYENDKQVIISFNPAWEHDRMNSTAQSWGFRKMLKYLKQVYNDPVICITELGYSDDGKLNDDLRARYFQRLFGVLLQSMHKDGVKIIGASIWSLLDDFEWVLGYYTHFGIIHVDQEDPTRKRTPKKSTLFFKKLTSTRRIPEWR
ncbi:hypothetical protein JTB14_023852 [Gonioctena quinquepunctata]|nr:hypothetical protein JTB14_023852 [Gonioctena quinquepunctata]